MPTSECAPVSLLLSDKDVDVHIQAPKQPFHFAILCKIAAYVLAGHFTGL